MLVIMNEKIATVLEYLTLSVENNEVTDVDKLVLAINDLENFPMTLEILDTSRVGQTLQSVRHSKNITIFISERIRFLIKSWRKLLDPDILEIVPNEIKNTLSKPPAAKNGYTNGYVRDPIVSPNEINHNKIEEPTEVNFKYKRKSPEFEIDTSTDIVPENNCGDETPIRLRNISNSSKVNGKPLLPQNESQNIPISQMGKPKLKSTKELLEDFSSLIESDTKNKILMNRISQEDDEPLSYFPKDSKVKELIQLSILQEERIKAKGLRHLRSRLMAKKRKHDDSSLSSTSEPEEKVPHLSKCESLLAQFNSMCTQRPQVLLKQFVPWPNMKRGLYLHPPEIKLPLSQRKRLQETATVTQDKQPIEEPPKNQLSMDVIDNLLEGFEVRAKQKQMISEAIQQRKEQTKVIDNTISLVDISMKLKLKIPKVPVIKLRRKRRKKKKKPKPKPIKIKIKKPRKPYVRPLPPITNYLDDIPVLPPITTDIDYFTSLEIVNRPIIDCEIEIIKKLAYGVFEGYNCTKHTQNSQIIDFTQMYSNIIDKKYFHIFPWVDLPYTARSSFPENIEEVLQSITNLPDFYS